MVERRNVPGLHQPPGYHHVALAPVGRLVTTAGAVPLDAAGRLVGPGNYMAQARQTLANLLAALAAAGASGRQVLKTTVYVVARDRADLVAVWDVVQDSEIAEAASTLLGVALLGYEGQLVEIEAIAAVG